MNPGNLRDKDLAVLQAVQDGTSTTAEIKEATTLSNREINYSLTEYSLQQMGLVEIKQRQGREWREVNGQERYVWKPKQVTLTDQGIQKLAETNTENRYEEMSRRELIQRVEELENRVTRLETTFKDFRGKVMERL